MSLLIAGLIAGGASLISGLIQGASQKSASDAQAKASQAGIDEQRRQFDAVKELMKPYVQAGNQSLDAQKDILGLNGQEAQAKAISGLSNSSEMQALVKQGETGSSRMRPRQGGCAVGTLREPLHSFGLRCSPTSSISSTAGSVD
jgi:hypothetical protein